MLTSFKAKNGIKFNLSGMQNGILYYTTDSKSLNCRYEIEVYLYENDKGFFEFDNYAISRYVKNYFGEESSGEFVAGENISSFYELLDFLKLNDVITVHGE